jgi:ribosome maturation factor RimP
LHSDRKKETEGNREFPSSFTGIMVTDIQLSNIRSFLEPLLDPDMFLVDMRIKPTNNIKVYLDADTGLPLEKCIKINRALYKKIEESGMYPNGDFSLEVSSPGIDEPLKNKRQFRKNVGRDVAVTMNDGRAVTGQLMQAEEESFTVSRTEGKGKKAVTIEELIPFESVKQVKVLVKF